MSPKRCVALLFLIGFAVVSARESSAQLLLLAPSTLEAASGTTFELELRCDKIPPAKAAALVLRVSTPAVLIPNPAEDTLDGIAPSRDGIEATDYMQLRFTRATADGIQSIRSRMKFTVGDDTVPASLEIVELIYVPAEGSGVLRVSFPGVKLVINEPEEPEVPEEPAQDDTG